MKYEKFDDPVALLIELCSPMTDDEKIMLGALGYKLSKDATYRKDYIYALKHFYLKNFQDIKSKKYVLQSFTRLNKELESNLGKKGKSVDMLPDYAVFSSDDADKMKTVRERVQILRKAIMRKR